MIMTHSDAALLYCKYTARHRELAIYITEECNLKCDVCYMAAEFRPFYKKKKFISKELIERAISLIDDEWVVTLYGGEPSLNLKLCKYAVSLAHSKGINVRMATNGKWPSIKKVLDLNLDYLSLGINDYHNVPQKRIQKILDTFSNVRVRTKIMVNGLYGNTDMSKFRYNKNIFIMMDETTMFGRGSVQSQIEQTNTTFCNSQGIAIRPNGDIIGFCRRGKLACKFGNLSEIDDSYFNDYIVGTAMKRLPTFEHTAPTWNSYDCVPGSMNNPAFDDREFKLIIT